jgi:hypothetical protein
MLPAVLAPVPPPVWSLGQAEAVLELTQEVRREEVGENPENYVRWPVEGGLVVGAIGSIEADVEDPRAPEGGSVVRFSGEVTATYGPSTLTAERLTIFEEAGQGIAEGAVTLSDPAGSLQAERVEFNWLDDTGEAFDAYVEAGNVFIWADRVEVVPEQLNEEGEVAREASWELYGVRATLSRSDEPPYSIRTTHVTLFPGREGVARDIELELFGLKLGRQFGGYDLRFSLDRRSTGFKFPEVAERKGSGYGLSWSSRILLDDRTGAQGTWNTFPGDLPRYGLQFSRAFVDTTATGALVTVESDLGEPFEHSYLDSLLTKSPRSAATYASTRRFNVAIGTAWNNNTVARPTDFSGVSKALEVSAEIGQDYGRFGWLATPRIQRIRVNNLTNWVDRAAVKNSFVAAPFELGGGLSLLARADSYSTFSGDGTFSWARAGAGLSYEPLDGMRLTGGYVVGENFGTPDFAFDPLVLEEAWHLRLDYERGPYTVRFLRKYDANSGEVFSDEYELAFVWEAFEPFILSRDFPSDFRFGFRLRIDDFLESLQQRSVERLEEAEEDRP